MEGLTKEDQRDLLKQSKAVDEIYIRRSATDFLLFTRGLYIPSAYGVKLFSTVIQDFQLDDFSKLAPSMYAVRDGLVPPIRRFWFERTKKGAKDSDAAIAVLWQMAFPHRPFKCQICAANRKQARIIENRAVELIHYNPWLKKYVEIVTGVIRNRAMHREVWTHIEATDTTGGAHGEVPDWLILNELVHVSKWQAMIDHMNNADGSPRGMVAIYTNAGVKGTPAEKWRKIAKRNPKRWYFSVLDTTAPWISEEDVRDAKRRDPIGSEFRRLWKGEWISGKGGAVDEDAIDSCFKLDGLTQRPEPGWRYIAGLDLGISHDHSGVVVVGVNVEEQKIRVARLRGWKPTVPNDKGKLEVDAQEVEDKCLRWGRFYEVCWFGYDPAAGGSFMAQSLRRKGMPMREMTFANPKNLTAMATAFVQAVTIGRLECYEDREGRLRRDFGKFKIVPRMPAGYKLESVSDEYGHADVGTALVICLPKALAMIGESVSWWDDGTDMIEDANEPLTDNELTEMSDGLRDIYECYDEVVEERRVSRDTGSL